MSHLAATLFLWASLAGQLGPAEINPDLNGRIVAAIRRLGDEQFAVREAATQELWGLGFAPEEALREAAKSPDAEVALRAKGLLDKIASGIFAETPPKVRQLVQGYQASNPFQKRDILDKLRVEKQPLIMLLLVASERDRNTQKALVVHESDRLVKGVRELLLQGEFSRAEASLRLLAEHEQEAGERARDYAAFLLLRGGLDDAVTKLKALIPPGAKTVSPHVLARLLQVQGNLGEARRVAETTGDRYLQADIYQRQEDWRAVLEANFYPQGQLIENLGFSAAFQRLAGDQERFRRAVARLHDERPESAWMSAEALMINGCWTEALDLLDPVQSFDLQTRQGAFREAFAGLKIKDPRNTAADWFAERTSELTPNSGDTESWFELGLKIAGTLKELNEDAQAARLVSKLEVLAGEGRADRWAKLFLTKRAIGLRDRTLEDAAKAVQDLPGRGQLFYHLYGEENQYLAHEGWQILREQHAAEDPQVTFAKLQSLLDPQAVLPAGLNLSELVASAEEGLPKLEVEQQAQRLQCMGKLCSMRDRPDLAVHCFELQITAAKKIKEAEFEEFEGFYPPRKIAPWWYIGDAYLHARQWQKAAAAYERAWQLDRRNAATLYLHGFALQKAGDPRGQRVKDIALLIPLADTVKRRELAEIMERLGEQEAALAQQELILRLGAYEGWEGDKDWAVKAAARTVADHVEAVDPLRAAALRQRAILYLLKTNTGYSEAGDYASAVHQIHRARAISLLGAERVEEGIKELKEAQRAIPGDVDLVLRVRPLLIAARREADGEAFFSVAFDALDRVCQDFPNCARQHHELARLCARTGRKSSEAEQHALAAVKLQPANAAYALTLADVQIQKGEQTKALAVLEEACRRNPKDLGLRKKLEELKSN